jgi:integrase/recombinase XerD
METQTKLVKKSVSVVDQACDKVKGFRDLLREMEDKMRLSDLSRSTLVNYSRTLGQICLHFGKLPQEISEKEINKYLADLTRQRTPPSRSNFKFTVYSLRYCYTLLGLKERKVELPRLKHSHKLPVVLNREETKILLRAPERLKERVLLSLLYSAGLRAGEASRLKIGDIDAGRMMIHIRQSKGKKDRYVLLSPLMLIGLRKYYHADHPVDYLFNGSKPGTPLSVNGMQWILRKVLTKCKLRKEITLHTLRHTYATHLLELGMDIVTIKELLGHERIETTMIYLHVAIPTRSNLFSPFDRLYTKS